MAEPDGDNRAADEPYTTGFEATVEAVDGREVALDRTYFYAEGGGQPPDRGTLGGIAIVDVQTRDGATVHVLEAEPTVEVGETVVGRVDEAFRTYAMRAHTASHVVYGAGRRLFEDHGYGGFGIGDETVRLDVETGDEGASVDPLALQRMANEVVWESREIDWYEMDAAEARADEEIVFNLDAQGGDGGDEGTDLGQSTDGGLEGDDEGQSDHAGSESGETETVRIVDVDGWDISACGGTHVRNTVEIGPIQVLEVSNPGADLVRVEYAVGERAIDHWVEERRQASRAAARLDTSVADLPGRVEGLASEHRALEDQVEDMGERLLEARLSALASDTVTVDGRAWLVGSVEAVGPNTAADTLGDGVGASADVVVLAGRDGSTFVVVGTDGETDASAIVDDVTDAFGGGGGGGPTLAQGGGIDAAPEAIVDYVRGQ
ncbi:MAG: alanine--tRNA ligase-related protein [Haloarculaceae archaeon]